MPYSAALSGSRALRLGLAALLGILVLTGAGARASAATCAAPPATQTKLSAEKQEWLAYGCSSDYARDLARVAAEEARRFASAGTRGQ